MLLQLIAAVAINTSFQEPAKPPLLIKRVRALRTDAIDISAQLKGAWPAGLTFMSYDPTDNSIIIEGDDAAIQTVIRRMTLLDHVFAVRWELSARRPFLNADTHLEFSGDGTLSAGKDLLVVKKGGAVTTNFARTAGLAYMVEITVTGDTRAVLKLDNGSSVEEVKFDPAETNRSMLRLPVPESDKDQPASVRLTVVEGKIEIKRFAINEALPGK